MTTKQYPPNLLRSSAGLSLLEKVLNGQAPNQEEMAVAQQMAQDAVRQQQKQETPNPQTKKD